MDPSDQNHYDVLVLGGGIAGMQASLDLADQGFRVAIVDGDATIGGKMIRLDKVFPTLDCASCITTPKMASVAHHKHITIFTLSEIQSVERVGGRYVLEVIRNPRYVDAAACIGCRQCEYACPIMVPDEDQNGLSARKAIYIPFSNAIPQIARLDQDHCTLCGVCQKICPTKAVDYFQETEKQYMESRALVVATGYKLLESFQEKVWGNMAHHPNLIDALKLERILAPTGPYGHMIRPSDGREPRNVAFLKCVGSRDRTLGVEYCSRVCCMYSIKNAVLIQQELPSAEVTIFYIDTRTFGKNHEPFLRNADDQGIRFIKAKPEVMGEGKDQGIVLRWEDQEGSEGIVSKEFDLVVTALAMIPTWDPGPLIDIAVAEDGFIASIQPSISPTRTNREGIFVAGTASGPKDIVDTILEAGAAAMEVANYLQNQDSAVGSGA